MCVCVGGGGGECLCTLYTMTLLSCLYFLVFKVAQEGHDQNFYIFLLVCLWSK